MTQMISLLKWLYATQIMVILTYAKVAHTKTVATYYTPTQPNAATSMAGVLPNTVQVHHALIEANNNFVNYYEERIHKIFPGINTNKIYRQRLIII